MLALRCSTSPDWTAVVLADFDAFLVDHAACERKASATGLSFVVRYPDRVELLAPLIAFAREELEHFERVYALIERRGLRLGPDVRDPYVQALAKHVSTGRDDRLIDRLLMAAVVEARGCERFGVLAEALQDPELAEFYREIERSEARHHGLFVRLARAYAEPEEVSRRLDAWLDFEAEVVASLPLRPALH